MRLSVTFLQLCHPRHRADSRAAYTWLTMPVTHALVHHAEGGFDESPQLDRLDDIIEQGNCVLWLDIKDPTEGDIELLRSEFGFHELALEDVVQRKQRAKIEQYPGYLFLVFYGV